MDSGVFPIIAFPENSRRGLMRVGFVIHHEDAMILLK